MPGNVEEDEAIVKQASKICIVESQTHFISIFNFNICGGGVWLGGF